MRSGFCIVLMTLLAGCSNSSTPGILLDSPDAGGGTRDSGGVVVVPDRVGFQLTSARVTLKPHDDVTYCYYFETPNSAEVAVKRWSSHMTDGVQQMIVFLTPGNSKSAGTLTADGCGLSSNSAGSVWSYEAHTATSALELPGDDGDGNAVAHMVKGHQTGFLEMHFVNPSSESIEAHVELTAYAYPDGISLTRAAPFVVYNTDIDLPAAPNPMAPTTDTVEGQCSVSPDAKFYFLSTRTNKQGTRTFVKNGATMVFNSSNWAEPGQATWTTAPFFSFTTGNLRYQCEYENHNGYSIGFGDNAATDEACVVTGYFFPAMDSTGHFCLNSGMIF